ncbi:MAG: HI0074 family nucleotidyltransferase substrate-binding subunit [Candidatus Omnitrophota bacterium]
MNAELNESKRKLKEGFIKLQEGVDSARNELEKDGVIQRFEFTFELLWKSIKIYLGHQGITVKTPRESFKAAFKIGIIVKEQEFLDMLEDRNKTSHIYSKEESEKIFNRIKNIYLGSIQQIVDKI